MAGATAAVGSSVVKVPLAVCIRSVQAGLHPNPIAAAQSLIRAAGVRSLFTVCNFPTAITSIDSLHGSLSSVPCNPDLRGNTGVQWLRDESVKEDRRRKDCGVQGFVPTLLEDVPDMAVKFAVYESLRPLHNRVFGGRQVRSLCCICPSSLAWLEEAYNARGQASHLEHDKSRVL